MLAEWYRRRRRIRLAPSSAVSDHSGSRSEDRPCREAVPVPRAIKKSQRCSFWAEEVVIRRQIDRRDEVHRDAYLLSGRRTFAACSLIGYWIYTSDDAVRYHKIRIQSASRKAKRSVERIARGLSYLHVARRVSSGDYVARRRVR